MQPGSIERITAFTIAKVKVNKLQPLKQYLHAAFTFPQGSRRWPATKRRHPSTLERLRFAGEGG
jgi:hypothetical protein